MCQGGRLADSGNETVSHPLPSDHDTAAATRSRADTGRLADTVTASSTPRSGTLRSSYRV